jgi:serine/threonine protein kinase
MVSGYELLENRSRPEGLFDVFHAKAADGSLVLLRVLRRPELRQVLVEELELARELNHPAAAPVLEVRQLGDRILFTQPFYEGAGLRSLINSERPWSLEEAAALLLPLLDALQAAHVLGLMHRDVAPENVFLTARGPVLIDFGLARVERLAGVPLTRAWLAPEQGQGKPATVATDVFQAGLLLFELLSARLPALGSVSEVVSRFTLGELDGPREAGIVDERAVRLLDRALAIEPSARFSSAAAFADAMRAEVTGALPTLDRLSMALKTSAWPPASRPHLEVVQGVERADGEVDGRTLPDTRRLAAVDAALVVSAVAAAAWAAFQLLVK